MTIDNENLHELFDRFLDPEHAIQAAEDIGQAERILAQFPAPHPEPVVLDEIKRRISRQLRTRKTRSFALNTSRFATIAAAILILTSLSFIIFKQITQQHPPMVDNLKTQPVLWDSLDIVADDFTLATYSAEVSQLENDLINIEIGDTYSNGYKTVTDLEIELVEISSDFWKRW